jgi:Rrf2 family protein
MKFSTKTRYGLRALIEIAKDELGEGVFQKDISKNQDISIKYLDQIIQSLKVAGLIVNVKGKKSGYILTRKPSEITVYDIHRAFKTMYVLSTVWPSILFATGKISAVPKIFGKA